MRGGHNKRACPHCCRERRLIAFHADKRCATARTALTQALPPTTPACLLAYLPRHVGLPVHGTLERSMAAQAGLNRIVHRPAVKAREDRAVFYGKVALGSWLLV